MNINLLWILVVLVLLTWITLEDFKYRGVRWWLFPILIVGFVGLEFNYFNIIESLLNVGFVVIQFLLLSIYFSIKERKLVFITKKYLGWGDIVFWIAACFLFSLPNYLFFFIASLVFSVLLVGLWKIVNKTKQLETIPLAGLQSLFVIILLVVSLFSNDNTFRGQNTIEKLLT